MTTTDTAHGADATNEDTAAAAVVAAAQDEAKQILASSRYDAFRLVTEARTEAETILEEARSEAAGILKAAEITAQSKIDAAEIRAAEIVEAAERTAADTRGPGTVGGAADLEEEHRELSDRVSSLRVLADQLERRFAALAESAPNGDGTVPDGGPRRVPSLDYSPSVPPKSAEPVQAPPEIPPAEEDPERGSFYSRRSAKLPRIGVDGGRSALDMTRSIRERLEGD